MTLREQFERTTCSCDECIECCKRQPGPLSPEDIGSGPIETLANAVGDLLVASRGAIVADSTTGHRFRVPTITPARKADGSCVFLTEDNRCAIHETAPFGCSHFDTHMGLNESQERSVALHHEILMEHLNKGPYHQLWVLLAEQQENKGEIK